MSFTPYLTFDGNCAEAFETYAQILGGEIVMMSTFEDMPQGPDTPVLQDEVRKRIMHAQLKFGDGILMASDVWGDYKPPCGMSVSIGFDDVDVARRVFDGLAEGGNVTMKFEETFWALGFGTVTDRFGTPWMVNCNKPES